MANSTERTKRIAKEAEVLDTIIKALQPLADDQRRRIVAAAIAFYDGVERDDEE